MKLMYFLSFVIVMMTACKKDKAEQDFGMMAKSGPYAGLWVESSLNKDTINFNAPHTWLEQLPWRPPSNAGVFFMGSETYKDYDGSTNSPGGIFSYYQSNDSLFIYNFFVSSQYSAYKFSVESSDSLKIEKFYERPGLPKELTFRRIR